MAYLFHALVGYVGGGHILIPTKIYAICRDLFILAVALDVVRRHMSKKKPMHYRLPVNHAASASTSLMMAAAALDFLNA